MQSKTTVQTLCNKVFVCHFVVPNNGIVASADLELDTTTTQNDSEMNNEVEERKSPSIAKVHNILEMWQDSQNRRTTQKHSRTQNKQMTAIGYISDQEEILKASWSRFEHDGVAADTL
jgi:hypothetical protein